MLGSHKEFYIIISILDYRRGSLSPLSLSLLANFGSRDAIDSIGALQIGFQNTDAIFQRNRAITPRRRTHSMSSNGNIPINGNGVHKSPQPRAKPPTVSRDGAVYISYLDSNLYWRQKRAF